MNGPRNVAEQACQHVMQRIILDPRVTYLLGPGTETFDLLTIAIAGFRGGTADEVRATIVPQLRSARVIEVIE